MPTRQSERMGSRCAGGKSRSDGENGGKGVIPGQQRVAGSERELNSPALAKGSTERIPGGLAN